MFSAIYPSHWKSHMLSCFIAETRWLSKVKFSFIFVGIFFCKKFKFYPPCILAFILIHTFSQFWLSQFLTSIVQPRFSLFSSLITAPHRARTSGLLILSSYLLTPPPFISSYLLTSLPFISLSLHFTPFFFLYTPPEFSCSHFSLFSHPQLLSPLHSSLPSTQSRFSLVPFTLYSV